MRRVWILCASLAVGCGGRVESTDNTDASTPAARDASRADSASGPISLDASDQEDSRTIDAPEARDVVTTETPLCPITMAYVDEAAPAVKSGTWISCPTGGPCPTGDCCLQYTGWLPPIPANTTVCVPVLEGGM
jgi:hypothetical protein